MPYAWLQSTDPWWEQLCWHKQTSSQADRHFTCLWSICRRTQVLPPHFNLKVSQYFVNLLERPVLPVHRYKYILKSRQANEMYGLDVWLLEVLLWLCTFNLCMPLAKNHLAKHYIVKKSKFREGGGCWETYCEVTNSLLSQSVHWYLAAIYTPGNLWVVSLRRTGIEGSFCEKITQKRIPLKGVWEKSSLLWGGDRGKTKEAEKRQIEVKSEI